MDFLLRTVWPAQFYKLKTRIHNGNVRTDERGNCVRDEREVNVRSVLARPTYVRRTSAHYYYYYNVHSQSYVLVLGCERLHYPTANSNCRTSAAFLINACCLLRHHTLLHKHIRVRACVHSIFHLSDHTEWMDRSACRQFVCLFDSSHCERQTQRNKCDNTRREEWPTQSYYYMLHSIKNVDFVTDSQVFMSRENCNLLFRVSVGIGVGAGCVCARATRLHYVSIAPNGLRCKRNK